jgi:hypothetical protein
MIQNPMYHHIAEPTQDEDAFHQLTQGPVTANRAMFHVWH